ncbi:hypothetical protein Plhal304r1_c003g0012351 [Plasmopara halstedii]
MVPESHQSFRLHVFEVLMLKSLADFVREASAWPIQQDFVKRTSISLSRVYVFFSGDPKICTFPCCVDTQSTAEATSSDKSLVSSRRSANQVVFNLGNYSRRILLSAFEDLQVWLTFRLSPVCQRFWFLEAVSPHIRYCIRDGCYAIDFEQHLFFDCTLPSQLWWQVLELVSPLFDERPTWLDIAD